MTLKELHDFVYGQDILEDPKLLMDQCEANMDLITRADLSNVQDYNYAMKLTCDYAISLENTGYFLKSLLFLEDAIELIKNNPGTQNESLFTIPSYEQVLFHKARAFYHLKNYRDSQSIFSQLQKALPQNEKYHSWSFMIKVKRRENWMWIGLGVMLITLMVKTYLNGRFPLWDQVSYCILLLALLSTAVFLILINKELRRVKKLDAL